MNGSLLGALSRSLAPSPAFAPLLIRPSFVMPLWTATAIGVAVLSMWHARRSVDHAFAIGVFGALLVSPLGWVYYLWLAVPGCAAVWRRGVPRAAVLGFTLLCVPLFAAPMWGHSGLSTVVVGSAYTWATLLLWFSALSARAPDPATLPVVR
jgi:hypothetical protein